MIRFLYSVTLVAASFFAALCSVSAQIDVEAYRAFVEANKTMSADELLQKYPVGLFRRYAPADIDATQYGGVVANKLALTSYEKQLLTQHSFVVTERKSYPSYNAAFLDGYINDLPLYISSDAVLHALHRSYDNMLKDLELFHIVNVLDKSLDDMRAGLESTTFSSDPLVQKAVNDADVYLSVAKALLTRATPSEAQSVFAGNTMVVHDLLVEASNESMSQIMLFADELRRDYDFSQFKPRGHYTENPVLEAYFRTMMWIGRTEIYITPIEPGDIPANHADIRRQCMLAVVLAHLAATTNAKTNVDVIDNIITKFVGSQDNLSLPALTAICKAMATAPQTMLLPEDLHKNEVLAQFQQHVRASGGEQKILSQLIYEGDKPIKPAAAFMLLGQRFILDSYILGNLVHDKVALRLMPSPLDAMFALGNDAAAQLIDSELRKFQYAPQLAGLRFLTSSLTPAYWKSSLYATWLNSIRALNPTRDRSNLPLFMQTGAWAQKQLNTQLTSWAELRHDNLLYAKQSYTGGIGCYYPSGFVEPIPAFYTGISSFAADMQAFVQTLGINDLSMMTRMNSTLQHMKSTCATLASMSMKELAGIPFTPDEEHLIKNWIMEVDANDGGCDRFTVYTGNYPRMMYGEKNIVHREEEDFVVADVHTQPTDEHGSPVGNVLHVATGRINTAVVFAADPKDQCATAYVGPVGSFYQHTTKDFNRLTDENWVELYQADDVPRPAWVYTYIANRNGQSPGEPQTLLTTGITEPVQAPSAGTLRVIPNPTSGTASISFAVPPSSSGKSIEITIVNAQGEVVSSLQSGALVAGSYITQWDGRDATQTRVAAGTYYVRMHTSTWSVVEEVVIVR